MTMYRKLKISYYGYDKNNEKEPAYDGETLKKTYITDGSSSWYELVDMFQDFLVLNGFIGIDPKEDFKFSEVLNDYKQKKKVKK